MLKSTVISMFAGITFLALILAVSAIGKPSSGHGLLLAVFYVYSLFILFGVLFVGLPSHLMLKKYGNSSLFSYSAVGVIPPVLVSFIFQPFGNDSLLDTALQAAIAAAIGFVCASTFWLLHAKSTNT